MAMKHTITMTEVKALAKRGVDTFSLKDNSPRGCKTISADEVKIGDKIVIDNCFCEVID